MNENKTSEEQRQITNVFITIKEVSEVIQRENQERFNQIGYQVCIISFYG